MAKESRKRVRLAGSSASNSRNSPHRDLKEKSLDEIVPIRSANAPLPGKGSLRKDSSTLAEEDPASDLQHALQLGKDDNADSSDEEVADVDDSDHGEAAAVVPSQLPSVPSSKRKRKVSGDASETAVVYLGRIPHGFYEDQMRDYFSQFGEVRRLRLSRSKRTGASKHYAFIEFAYPSVAQVVQETMDNYLLAGHILVCKVLSPEQVHPKLWIGAGRKFRAVPRARLDAARRNETKTADQKKAIRRRSARQTEQKSAELAELGIEY